MSGEPSIPRESTNAAPPLPFRIGHGYDLHRLEPAPPAGKGRPFVLAGVRFDHPLGPVGHSDGDAVYHAVTDALLGALGLPDIGQLFPDTDPRFEGSDSTIFLAAARDAIAERGFALGNLDITVICEKPKLAERKAEMIGNLVRTLGCERSQVNLKGKTHEKVDAVGEGRAIEVHAVALLVRCEAGSSPEHRTEHHQKSQEIAEPTARSHAPRDYTAISAGVSAQGPTEARLRLVVASLWMGLAPSGVSWVGFYLDRPEQPPDTRLILGPREPKAACSPIGLHGVCGQALLAREVRIVRDTADLGPNYIACDPKDRSEIVLPLLDEAGKCWAVLDLDSHEVGSFDESDAEGLASVLRAAGFRTAAARSK